MARAFLDSNVLLYAVSADPAKADRAEGLLVAGGVVSVQVLNEVANVARRKMHLEWRALHDVIARLSMLLDVEPITIRTHELGLSLAERHRLSVYDAMIAAAALLAGCDTLYSEDMHDGLQIEQRLRVVNPFVRT